MQVINIQEVGKTWWHTVLRQLPSYDPFLELCALPRTVLAIQKDSFSLFRGFSLGRQFATSVPAQQSENLYNIVNSLKTGEEVVLSISVESCFSRRLNLPKNALAKIEQILDLDIARTTPFSRKDIFSGWINEPSPLGSIALNIEHIVIQRAVIVDIVEIVRNSGARPIGFVVHEASGVAKQMAKSVDGSPFGHAEMNLWRKIGVVSLGVLVSAVVVFATTVFYLQSQAIANVDTQSQRLEEIVGEVRRKLDIIKTSSAEISSLQSRKSAVADPIEIIEELSRILPDEAFLDAMVIETNRVNIDGGAKFPEQLIAALETSAMFQNVSFSSPVFKNPGDLQSHFSIKLELELPPRRIEN
jgi:general secretion pathway protein L